MSRVTFLFTDVFVKERWHQGIIHNWWLMAVERDTPSWLAHQTFIHVIECDSDPPYRLRICASLFKKSCIENNHGYTPVKQFPRQCFQIPFSFGAFFSESVFHTWTEYIHFRSSWGAKSCVHVRWLMVTVPSHQCGSDIRGQSLHSTSCHTVSA